LTPKVPTIFVSEIILKFEAFFLLKHKKINTYHQLRREVGSQIQYMTQLEFTYYNNAFGFLEWVDINLKLTFWSVAEEFNRCVTMTSDNRDGRAGTDGLYII